MVQRSTVLILGATGRLGSACVEAFSSRGWQVIAQQRRESHLIRPNVQVRSTGAGSLVEGLGVLPPLDVVVHAMSPTYTDAAWAQEAPQLMGSAIQIARSSGATLMLPGNVYNFGANMPANLHENCPMTPTNSKGRIRVALEQMMREAASSGDFRAVVLRAGDFFGKGQGVCFDQVIARKLNRGVMGYPGNLETSTPWAYLPDLAKSFALVAEARSQLASFEVIHFRGHDLDGRDWLRELQAYADKYQWTKNGEPLKVSGVPWSLIRISALFSPIMKSLLDVRYLYQRSHRLHGDRLAELIGSEPHTPLHEAIGLSLVELGLVPKRQQLTNDVSLDQ